MAQGEMGQTPAVVLGCNYNGLALIQALGRRRIPVWALDSTRSIGTYSRYARYFRVPDPLTDEGGFIENLVTLAEGLKIKPLLMPTHDHWAEAISRHRTELEKAFTLAVSDHSTVSLLLDKEQFGLWGLERGLPVPKIWAVEDALREREALPYPVAVKAVGRRRAGQEPSGRTRAQAADRLRFRPCNNPRELTEVIQESIDSRIPVFCQQVVRGRSSDMRTIGVYARKGRVGGIMYGRKVRGFPPLYGDCVVGRSEPVPDWAYSLVTQACQALDYTGIAEFEVMEDAVSGERYLIEINPRSWSWIGVAAPSGVDLAWLSYSNLVLGQEISRCEVSCEDGESRVYAKILTDFQNAMLWYRFTDARDWVMSPVQWFKGFMGQKLVFAEFAADDPLVAVMSVVASAKEFLRKAVHVMRRGTPA